MLKDDQWSKNSFMIRNEDYPAAERYLRQFNSADMKYHDTALGGNNAINPLPQFTRFADPPIKGTLNTSSTGMGGTYSEAFDDNQQVIYLRYGVPKYNSMVTFFSGFYNYRAGVIARTGRVPEGFYLLGVAAGTVATVVGAFVFPLFTALTSGLAMVGYAARFMLNMPSSKYYYLKPTMTTYWTVTSLILNYLVINMGYLSQQADESDVSLKASSNKGLTPTERKYMHDHLPDLFAEDGFIDVYAVATRAQRLARRQEREMAMLLETEAPNGVGYWFGRAMAGAKSISEAGEIIGNSSLAGGRAYIDAVLGPNAVTSKPKNQVSLAAYLRRWKDVNEGKVQPDSSVEKDSRTPTSNIPSTTDKVTGAKTEGNTTLPDPQYKDIMEQKEGTVTVEADRKNDSWWQFLQAEWDDGGAFAAFRVDYTGSQSESFSSSVADSEVKTKFNSTASSNRTSFFNTIGKEIAAIPALGPVLAFMGTAAKDTMGGIADSSGLSGLMALGGSAFVDIPKHWQDSSFSGMKMSYSMTLDAIYNHPVSRIMNQYMPLAMLMAGSIPLGAGKQSYTSPFICECYDRGRAVTRLGIIKDLSISRGNGNLGFLNNGTSLTFEVSFSIEDLSNVVAAPLSAFYSANIVGSCFDDDTNFSDYMAVLTGMGLTDMTYPSNKVARNWSRNMANARRFSPSSAYWGSVFGSKLPTKVMSIYYKGIDKQ